MGPPALSLSDAILAVQQTQEALKNADLDQNEKTRIYEEAQTAKKASDDSDIQAIQAFNDSLDALVAVATTSKVVR